MAVRTTTTTTSPSWRSFDASHRGKRTSISIRSGVVSRQTTIGDLIKDWSSHMSVNPTIQSILYSNSATACDGSILQRLEKAKSSLPKKVREDDDIMEKEFLALINEPYDDFVINGDECWSKFQLRKTSLKAVNILRVGTSLRQIPKLIVSIWECLPPN